MKIMNKKGLTILELVISIAFISLIVLLLIKIFFSIDKLNTGDYARDDEIKRVEIIKNIESDFLELKLNGLNINKSASETSISFKYEDSFKELKITNNKITYDNIAYVLESSNATYSLCPLYNFRELDSNYYLLEITIPVLINNKNTSLNDDIVLTYIGLKNDKSSFIKNFKC